MARRRWSWRRRYRKADLWVILLPILAIGYCLDPKSKSSTERNVQLPPDQAATQVMKVEDARPKAPTPTPAPFPSPAKPTFVVEELEEHWPDGSLKLRQKIVGDELKVNGWHANGKRAIVGQYDRQGRKQGLWESWLENGKRRDSGRFIDGLKHGGWTEYQEGTGEYRYPEYERGTVVRWAFE